MAKYSCLLLAAAVVCVLLTHQQGIAAQPMSMSTQPMPSMPMVPMPTSNTMNMKNPTDMSGPQNIAAAAAAANLTILIDAIAAVGGDLLDVATDTNASLTVFAPTNEAFKDAFAAFGVNQTEIFANKTLLETILLFHVVPGLVPSKAATQEGVTVMTLLGQNITLTMKDGEVDVEGYKTMAKVLKPDVTAGQSLVHVINKVLVPEL